MIDELERLGLPVVQVTPKGDKKSRMQMHIPKFANGQIQFPREKPGCADVVRQLLDFSGGRLTDIVDSISQALTYEVSECQWNDTNLENFARFNAALGGGFW
jgi:phage terminase large subunit-like protein